MLAPCVQLTFPSVLLALDLGEARVGVAMAFELQVAQAPQDVPGGEAGVALDRDVDLLDQAEDAVVDVDLDDLGVGRPIVDVVLGQRAERAETGAQREHDVGLGDCLHRRLRALIAERAHPQVMVGRERVVVQIGRADRRLEELGKLDQRGLAVAHDDTAAGEDHRELGLA